MPPDPYNDVLKSSYGLWENTGWVIDTQGDLRQDVQYVTEGAQPRAYIRRGGKISFVLASVDTTSSTLDTLRRLDMELVGEGALHPDAVSFLQKGYMQNFYLPHCGQDGVTNVRGYSRILYPSVYHGIDMWMYSGQRGQKLMFVIQPGAHPADLQMQFTGQDQMDVDVLGWLKMQLGNKWIRLPQAVAYQYNNNNEITPVNWTADYLADNGSGVVGFNFETYDTTKPLVLLIGPPPMQGGPSIFTPGLCWSTYLGGDGWDGIKEVKAKNSEGLFATGWSNSTFWTFPMGVGNNYSAAQEIVTITKFNESHVLLWTTRYGGSTGFQRPAGLDIDTHGSTVFVCGYVNADDMFLPATQPTGWYVDPTSPGGQCGFLASFERASGHIYYATYFGEPSTSIWSIAIDALGNVFFCGATNSSIPAPTNDPPAGATMYPFSGGRDAYVARLNQERKLDWSTYLGGTEGDGASCVRTALGKVVVAGESSSDSMQTLPTDNGDIPYFPSNPYGSDFFIQEFTTGGHHVWGSFFGYHGQASSTDQGWKGLAIDPTNGDILLGGGLWTQNLLPVTTAWPWCDSTYCNNAGFLVKYDGATKDVKYATFISGSGSTFVQAIEVGYDGQTYLAGHTADPFLGSQAAGNLYSSADLLGNEDGFIMVLTSDNWRTYLTYFGGNETTFYNEAIQTLSLGSDGQIYVGGYTGAAYNDQTEEFFPLHDALNGAWWDSQLEGYRDGFVTSLCASGTWTSMNEPSTTESAPFCFQTGEGLTFVKLPEQALVVNVSDPTGRLVMHRNISAHNNVVPTASLASGVYIVTVPGALSTKLWVR
jgi:hypothetical protein